MAFISTDRLKITIKSYGDSFSAAGPRVQNALPSYLRQDMNYIHLEKISKRTHVQAVLDHPAL